MDLASIFILLLNWVVRILISVPLGPEIVNSRQSCSLNFLIRHVVSWHGPLRCKTAAFFRKLLNIRNIFRVAFLSCSHIRLEICSRSLQGRSPSCLCRSVLFCATTFDMLSPNRGFVNNIFSFSFRIFFQKLAVQCSLSAQDPAGNLLLSSRCFSAAKCILPLPNGLCKHFFEVFNFRSAWPESLIFLIHLVLQCDEMITKLRMIL